MKYQYCKFGSKCKYFHPKGLNKVKKKREKCEPKSSWRKWDICQYCEKIITTTTSTFKWSLFRTNSTCLPNWAGTPCPAPALSRAAKSYPTGSFRNTKKSETNDGSVPKSKSNSDEHVQPSNTVLIEKNCDLNQSISSIHEGKKPFKCEYKSVQKDSLKQHVSLIHDGKVPFKCEICDLSGHISSTHEVKKPFKCKTCEYKCAQKDSLKQHVLSVHEGKKASKCKICDLSQHISSIHEGNKAKRL